MFSESLTNYETWQLAENLDPRIELRWIMPGHPTPKYVCVPHCQMLPVFCQLVSFWV